MKTNALVRAVADFTDAEVYAYSRDILDAGAGFYDEGSWVAHTKFYGVPNDAYSTKGEAVATVARPWIAKNVNADSFSHSVWMN